MKRLCICVLLLFFAGACVRHKIIPDDKLASIFHDAFLTNAYVSNRPMKLDSMEIYEPIFAKYGYTTEDLYYTIGDFSKRKSARLSDVVEKAIAQLEAEDNYYNREVSILDTIDNVARRAFTHRIYTDSLIRVRSLRDTSLLHFTFKVRPGEYNVSFSYLVDSVDENKQGIGASLWLQRADSTHTAGFNMTLRRYHTERVSRRFTADTTHRTLHINLADLNRFRQKPARPSITVRDFAIDYTPVQEVAVDSLFFKQLGLRIFADDFLPRIDTLRRDSLKNVSPKDSL